MIMTIEMRHINTNIHKIKFAVQTYVMTIALQVFDYRLHNSKLNVLIINHYNIIYINCIHTADIPSCYFFIEYLTIVNSAEISFFLQYNYYLYYINL